MPSNQKATSEASGNSKLCLACGLCCTGAFFTKAVVEPSYLEIAAELGVTVDTLAPDSNGFWLPCGLYRNGQCSIYQHRPPVCQSYRCVLLRKYERGEIALDECLRIVQEVKKLLTDGGKNPQEQFSLRSRQEKLGKITELTGGGQTAQTNAALMLRAAALEVLIQRYFRLPAQDSPPEP